MGINRKPWRMGGFPPGTRGKPQPFGMPTFLQGLGSDDIAAVTTSIRQSRATG